MKILIDTNIVLDVMLKREPFYKSSLEILGLSKKDDVEEYVSASAITDIYYLAYRQLRDKGMVKKLMKKLQRSALPCRGCSVQNSCERASYSKCIRRRVRNLCEL